MKIAKNLITLSIIFAITSIFGYKTVDAAPILNIVIDPGHGGPADNSADMGANYNGNKEKDINLTTALILKKELEKYGNVKVYLTRTSDKHLELGDRVKYAKSVNADVMICVHYNASGSHLLYGGEIFVPSTGSEYQTGYGIASKIADSWKTEGNIVKGIKTRIGSRGDYYGVIRIGTENKIPTIILEHCYMDNNNDSGKIKSEEGLKKFALLDAKGIADYYGLEKNVHKAKINPTVNVAKPTGVIYNDTTGPENFQMYIDSYNKDTGEVKITMTADEAESNLMYFGVSADCYLDGNDLKLYPDLKELFLWGDEKKVTYSFNVEKGYVGPLYGICYNNYDLHSNSVVALLQ